MKQINKKTVTKEKLKEQEKQLKENLTEESQRSINGEVRNTTIANSNHQIEFFENLQMPGILARNDSEESRPGAWAIPGPQLIRQERISLPLEPHNLIEARIVEEEQPSLIFEASLLQKRKNWKWILAVSFLIFLLTTAVAGIFIQESIRRKVMKKELGDGLGNTPSTSQIIQSISSLIPTSLGSTVPTGMPSIDPVLAVTTEQPTLNPTTQPTTQPTVSPTQEPTMYPTEDQTNAPSGSSFNEPSQLNYSSLPYFMPKFQFSKWQAVGQSIIGEHEGDILGQSVALSVDGKILAIGINLHDSNVQKNNGMVRVLRLEDDNCWKQLGQDLLGSEHGDQAGWSIDLSSDGSVVAVGFWAGGNNEEGAVQVYQYNSDYNFWTPMGQKLYGNADGVFFSGSISLSSDGFRLIVGADDDDNNGEDTGRVQIYRYSPIYNQWSKVSQTFQGKFLHDRVGFDVSICGNGEIAAMGLPNKDNGDAKDIGVVRVYEYTYSILGFNNWNLLGDPISVNEAGFGFSVDLSADGMTLATSSRSGVHVYQFDAYYRNWAETSARINLEIEDNSDISNEIYVSLSPDGRTLAVSIGNSYAPGFAKVYRLNKDDTKWVMIGNTIEGSGTETSRAPSIFLASSDQLAVGFTKYSDGNGLDLGKAQVYELYLHGQ
mmetsp:Transcript_25735/g.29411  ORF Transcript_25735/g.29411 Transcript_25735/m.29411 type:complete len:659 (+) Transcript_25735:152-2128(+)